MVCVFKNDILICYYILTRQSICYSFYWQVDKLNINYETQYSFSDDPKNLECIHPFNIHIKDVVLKAGAEFIVIITGKIMTMPGLPRIPAAENIDIDKNGNIIGIF